MDKFFINEKGLVIKNVLVNTDFIAASDENYKTKENFLEKINAPKKLLDTRYKIAYEDILKFFPEEPELAIQLFFKVKEKTEKTYFEFNTSEEYTEVKNYLIEKTKLSLGKELKSNYTSWIKPALYTLVSIIISVISYFIALDVEKGEEITVSGSRRGLKRIFVFVAENLGSTGTLIAGLLIVIGLSIYTVMRWKNGKKEVIIYS